jgi:hypothetical protein
MLEVIAANLNIELLRRLHPQDMARKNKLKQPKPDLRSSPRNTRPKTSAKPWEDGDLPPKFDLPTAQAPTASALKLLPARTPGVAHTTPFQVPGCVSTNHPLLPPHTDDASLRNSHDVHVVAVASSTKIEIKVRAVLSLLNSDGSKSKDGDTGASKESRPVLVALVARAQAANKCISITEITKRELHKTGEKQWHQYTHYWTRLEAHTPMKKEDGNGKISEKEENEDLEDDDDAFEPLDTAEKHKIRSVPCLVIYLATTPVTKLKEAYG